MFRRLLLVQGRARRCGGDRRPDTNFIRTVCFDNTPPLSSVDPHSWSGVDVLIVAFPADFPIRINGDKIVEPLFR
jgi:hypothetical protein